MREPQTQQQTLLDDEATLIVSGEETTLVAPRFDDEETLVARPVVPLDADAPNAAPEREATPPAHFKPRSYAPRPKGMFALVLFSVLVGGVLGGAGLYLYQRQSQDPAVSPTVTTQPAAPADAAQAPAPNVEAQPATPNAEASAQQTEAPVAAAPNAAATTSPAVEVPAAAPARVPENVPVAERRASPSGGGEAGTPRRGKKGDHDQEIEHRTTPPADGNVARAAAPEARKVDSIFYRPRRAERRARRGDDVDRLRRIFEGTP